MAASCRNARRFWRPSPRCAFGCCHADSRCFIHPYPEYTRLHALSGHYGPTSKRYRVNIGAQPRVAMLHALIAISENRRQRTFQSSISQSTCEHLLLSPDCAGRRAPIPHFLLEVLSTHMSEILLPVLRRLQGVRDILVLRWLRGGEL